MTWPGLMSGLLPHGVDVVHHAAQDSLDMAVACVHFILGLYQMQAENVRRKLRRGPIDNNPNPNPDPGPNPNRCGTVVNEV